MQLQRNCNVFVTTMYFKTAWDLDENVLNSNFELLHVSEIRQISVIQKLEKNFVAQ